MIHTPFLSNSPLNAYPSTPYHSSLNPESNHRNPPQLTLPHDKPFNLSIHSMPTIKPFTSLSFLPFFPSPLHNTQHDTHYKRDKGKRHLQQKQMIIATLSNSVNSCCNDNSNKENISPLFFASHSPRSTTPSILSPYRLQQPPPSRFPTKHTFQRTAFHHLPSHTSQQPRNTNPHTTNRTSYIITTISPISLHTLPSHTPITPQLSLHAITPIPTATQFHKPSSNSYPQTLSTIRSRGQPFIPFQYSRIVTICHHE